MGLLLVEEKLGMKAKSLHCQQTKNVMTAQCSLPLIYMEKGKQFINVLISWLAQLLSKSAQEDA